ncbi:biopolymer transporter ExbD [Sphingomonas sp. NSE70-1]|uniref:Biopolymer transporter ExbD n=1 Tax=Sphingomonas caseinilyticus TaxID=2908205 RepID=A0ABT0RQM5_9SPHN|nr:biopolymer transporter ExbD [Sphingomonas caseinilyticus]MCL6697214.1 biopolymer transporter ExbD [Sphingomonas caseinilyticus]
MARSMSSSPLPGGIREIPPMAEMNTTPLIDVMLVLLIMFIITVPMQSHQIEQQLPQRGPIVKIERIKNELGMSPAGQLRWNGEAISDRELASALSAIAGMDEQPEVHFRPDATARYERVDHVLGIAAQSGADRFGFSGNEQYGAVF